MTPINTRRMRTVLLGFSLAIAVALISSAGWGAGNAEDRDSHPVTGTAAEELEWARDIVAQGGLGQMELQVAPRLRKIAFGEQPEQAVQAWFLLAEILARLRDEFAPLTGPLTDGSVGTTLVRQGKNDLAVDVLIREAWLLRSPAQIHLELLYTYPVAGFERHDSRILKFYEQSSAEGIPRSQFFMGMILLNGWGVPRDEDSAIELLQGAGLGVAIMELATYEFGQGDMAMAEQYLEQAAAENIPGAHYNLGVFAQNRKDYAKAASSFTKTLEIDPDYAEARLELARMHVEGWGVEQNEELGFEMMKRVADSAGGGVAAVAQMNVGNFYLGGMGAARDLVLAREYFQKAFNGGYTDAEIALKQLDEIQSELLPDQQPRTVA